MNPYTEPTNTTREHPPAFNSDSEPTASSKPDTSFNDRGLPDSTLDRSLNQTDTASASAAPKSMENERDRNPTLEDTQNMLAPERQSIFGKVADTLSALFPIIPQADRILGAAFAGLAMSDGLLIYTCTAPGGPMRHALLMVASAAISLFYYTGTAHQIRKTMHGE